MLKLKIEVYRGSWRVRMPKKRPTANEIVQLTYPDGRSHTFIVAEKAPNTACCGGCYFSVHGDSMRTCPTFLDSNGYVSCLINGGLILKALDDILEDV